MTSNTVEERKRNIDKIKASFSQGNPAKSDRFRDFSSGSEPETQEGRSFFKLKLLLAIAIFAAFVFVDQNQLKIGEYSTREVFSVIRDSVSVEKVMENVEGLMK